MKKHYHGAIGTCQECGKKCFLSRKEAKQYYSKLFPGSNGLTVYRCPDSEYFHFGHTPYGVQRGFQQRGTTPAVRRLRQP